MAKFTKGNPGRPKGAKGKKTILKAEQVMATANFNPVQTMINLVQETGTPIDIKARLLIELNSLINPKAKQSETPNAPDDDEELPDLTDLPSDELTNLVKIKQNQ